MKKALLLIAVMVGCMTASAQKIDKNELRQLQQFLSLPGEKDATNAQALKITDLKNPSSWEGVTVENGHVTAIEWSDKHLAGSLDLSGFTALTKLNVSRTLSLPSILKAPPQSHASTHSAIRSPLSASLDAPRSIH